MDNSRLAKWSDMFSGSFLFITIFGPFALMSACSVFYGITLGLNTLSGSIIFNGAFSGSGDLLAGIMLGIGANKCGRKGYYIFGWLLLIISFSVYILAFHSFFLDYASLFTGKFASTTVFQLMYLILYESVPTNIRATFVGIASAFARVGAAFSPILASYLSSDVGLVYAGIGVVCFCGSFFLTETKGKPLIERIVPTKMEE